MAKLTPAMLRQIEEAADGIDYGSINIKLNAASSSVDIAVTRDIRVLKDDEQSSRPGRVVVHAVSRQG